MSDAPLRVLHIQPGPLYGGIQRTLVCCARERGLAPSMQPEFALCFAAQVSEELLAAGVPVHFLGEARTRSPGKILRARRRLRVLLKGGAFDVAVCHDSWSLAMFGSVISHRGIPLVFWMHNNATARNRNVVEFLAGRQKPRLVVCNSAFTAASLPLFFMSPPPHAVIPCPVSKPKMQLESFDCAAERAKLETPADAVVIAIAGRLESWKGHAQLLETLASLHEVPRWICWIIGGAVLPEQKQFESTLRASAATLGIADRVRFLGHRRDVPELLRSADIFCQPNLHPEPFGIVFVEALYAGLPIVSIAHGGVCEIADETCSRLVPPGRPELLAAALRELIENAATRATLSAAAPARANAVASPQRILPMIYETLKSIRVPR